MKKTMMITAAVLGLSLGISLSSCGGSKDSKEPQKENTTPGDSTKTQASAYVCPMGYQCGHGDKPGKCPNCGSEMVKNESH